MQIIFTKSDYILEVTIIHMLGKCNPNFLGLNASSLDGTGSVRVSNGMIIYNDVLPGAVAHLVCNEGYMANVEARDRTCFNGTWTDSIQICGEVILNTVFMYAYMFIAFPTNSYRVIK